jgi:hypothetical protein
MAFLRNDGIGLNQAITDTSTTQLYPFGTRVRCYDPTYGEGEFVYVKGVSSGAANLLCTVNLYTGVTALTGARSKGMVGVMMSALAGATTYGWVQVRGAAVIATAGSVVSGATVYLTGTAGKVDDAVVAGDIVYGANFSTADGTPAANQAVVSLVDPFCGDTDNA